MCIDIITSLFNYGIVKEKKYRTYLQSVIGKNQKIMYKKIKNIYIIFPCILLPRDLNLINRSALL